MDCPFCNMMGGKHQRTCSSLQSNSLLDQFMAAQQAKSEMKSDVVNVLIEQYIGLMTAYAMTLDACEFAGKSLGKDRLTRLARFIEDAVDTKIDEILAVYEEEANEEEM